jgi:hypothetical protein
MKFLTMVVPVQIIFDKLDFATTNLVQLEAQIRQSLQTLDITEYATMPISFASGSGRTRRRSSGIIATLFPQTQTAANILTKDPQVLHVLTAVVQNVFTTTTTTITTTTTTTTTSTTTSTSTTTTTWVFNCCCYLLPVACVCGDVCKALG